MITPPDTDRRIFDTIKAPTRSAEQCVAGLLRTPQRLTADELSLVVALLGRGVTLQQAIDRIQAQRPSLPFTPEAA